MAMTCLSRKSALVQRGASAPCVLRLFWARRKLISASSNGFDSRFRHRLLRIQTAKPRRATARQIAASLLLDGLRSVISFVQYVCGAACTFLGHPKYESLDVLDAAANREFHDRIAPAALSTPFFVGI